MTTTEVIQPYDEIGRPLSPYEAETGVVLPILPVDDPHSSFPKFNDHHAHFEKRQFTHGTQNGEMAVCYTRLQHGPRWIHRRYHGFFHGTELPESIHDSFRLAVLNQTYVPAWAVDVSGSSPEIVRPNEYQARYLLDPDTFRMERKNSRRAEIGKFLMHYALWQELPLDQQYLIEELIAIKPKDARRNPEVREYKERIAARLIGKSLQEALRPLEPGFKRALSNGQQKEGTPPSPWLVVRSFVGQHLTEYFRALEMQHRLAGRQPRGAIAPDCLPALQPPI